MNSTTNKNVFTAFTFVLFVVGAIVIFIVGWEIGNRIDIAAKLIKFTRQRLLLVISLLAYSLISSYYWTIESNPSMTDDDKTKLRNTLIQIASGISAFLSMVFVFKNVPDPRNAEDMKSIVESVITPKQYEEMSTQNPGQGPLDYLYDHMMLKLNVAPLQTLAGLVEAKPTTPPVYKGILQNMKARYETVNV